MEEIVLTSEGSNLSSHYKSVSFPVLFPSLCWRNISAKLLVKSIQ